MDIQAIWSQACAAMHREMTEVTFNTWIRAALRPLGAEGDQFYIEAVTDFYYSFVVPRDSVLISNALSEVAGRPVKAKILTPAQAEKYRAGAAIGGSIFGNFQGQLPKRKGRTYYECDIGTVGKKSRGAQRIIYSNDGLIYFTGDHYETYILLYGEE